MIGVVWKPNSLDPQIFKVWFLFNLIQSFMIIDLHYGTEMVGIWLFLQSLIALFHRRSWLCV